MPALAARLPYRVILYGSILLALLVLEIVIYLVLSVQRQVPLGRDAWSYIAAARAIAAGHSPYTLDLAFVLPEASSPPSPYLYPPFLALLLTPLASLPLPYVLAVWLIFMALVHVALIGALSRMLGWRVATLAVLVWLPTWQGLFYGQINALVALCLTFAICAVQRQRDTTSSMWLLAGVLLKITPGISLLLYAAQRKWKALAICAGCASAVIVLSLPIVPLRWWLDGVIFALTTRRANPAYNSWGAALGQLPGVWGTGAPLILACGVVALTIWRGKQVPVLLAVAATLFVPLLVARTTWEHHAVMVLPALAVLWGWNVRARWLAAGTWCAVGLIGAFAMPLALTCCWIACLWPAWLAEAS